MSEQFVRRHIGLDAEAEAQMLDQVGYPTIQALMDAAIPKGIRSSGALELPEAISEQELARRAREVAQMNRVAEPMIGLGFHGTVTPAVIRRNVLEDPAWYTAYTPYQPEISQGRLEALLNFQTMIADLSGLPVANASLLDEPTAAAEAMTLIRRASQGHPDGVFLVDQHAVPATIEVISTRAEALGIRTALFDPTRPLAETLDGDDGLALLGVLVQFPGADGEVRELSELCVAVHERGGSVVAAADLLALTLLEAPGEWGADVVIGSAQRFGIPLFYGGPHAGFIAVAAGLERHLPGRLVGVSVDAEGRPAYRLALQTREQHIRREKATSNICTAQVLLAVGAAMYAVYHGPEGLRRIAERVHARACEFAVAVRAAGSRAGVDLVSRAFFDTVVVRTPGLAAARVAQAREAGFHLRLIDADQVGLSFSEVSTAASVAGLKRVFGLDGAEEVENVSSASFLPSGLARTTPFLQHPVFSAHHSETQMLRYLRSLAGKDYALDRGMIPLGSCTMKLNATSEMEPISLPGFADLHPYAPAEDAAGYRLLVDELEGWLAEATGYDRVSIQPNAGSQGELAGLLAIRAYHRAAGQPQRDVCLLPASAHGTNAASAVMAGMRVVVVATGPDGEIDHNDLRAKIEIHREQIAAIMVTYPSTHGVYEDDITELCDLIHAAGGQVYVDGANFNALLGYAKPGHFGGDVSHLNLHKTFCIPHGGGGPGGGPVAVRSHLAPFLPSHAQHPEESKRNGIGAISGAPYGSAGILPISWAYIQMMGAAGLTSATAAAVLAANYVASRLGAHYPILYRGQSGLVAHECLLDLRPVTKETGVTAEDVAKRLVDYGFHAPTMSFPVAGTLMVEPTESEDLGELDRFIDAMIAIRSEIADVAAGRWSVQESPLRRAPHTVTSLVAAWDRPYSREQAVFPAGIDTGKYWPPVARLDHAFGDRNLLCSCPPPEAFDVSVGAPGAGSGPGSGQDPTT